MIFVLLVSSFVLFDRVLNQFFGSKVQDLIDEDNKVVVVCFYILVTILTIVYNK